VEEKNMNAKRKSFIPLALVAVFFACFLLTGCEAEDSRGGYHASVIDATADFYINDFAGLFTEQQKAAMMEKATQLSDETGGIQVVITTVESLDSCVTDGSKGLGIEQVSYAMYEQYGIGKDDMGALVLFSVGDREVWMMTGRQMQFYITDKRAGELQDDYAMEYFRQDQFADGLISLQDGIISEIRATVPQDWSASEEAPAVTEEPNRALEETIQVTEPQKVQEEPVEKKSSGTGYGIVGIFLALIAGLILAVKKSFSSGRRHEQEIQSLQKQHKKELEDLKETYTAELKEKQEAWQETEAKLHDAATSWRNKLEQAENDAQQAEMNSQKTIHGLQASKDDLEQRLAILQDKFDRAQRLHPEINFATEIHEMIEGEYREEAERTDKVLRNTLALPADKDNIDSFLEAIRYYQNINPEIQKYMKTNVKQLHSLLDQSKALKQEFERAEQEKKDRADARRVCEVLLAVSHRYSNGNHENYQELADACREYDRLNQAAKGLFPDGRLVQRIQSLLAEAEADTKNWKEGQKAQSKVESIVSRVGYRADEDDLNDLTSAMRIYQGLSSAEAAYFSMALYNKLKRLIREAQDDQEEQERRRRRQREEAARRAAAASASMSSTTRHSSSSSFGGGFGGGHSGFGGRPSGGGAGRRF